MTSKSFGIAFDDAIAALHADAKALGVSISQICEEAGVSRATPHRYLKVRPTTVDTVERLQAAVDKHRAPAE
ncbi:hypothetical protein [Parvibaculum sp.]|uniref:hypothetical protein n=1 Tax=Parvibaculum sp. TaxID=2024848 RepID=UPI00273281FD|nr:hypothetical protein [Parvibaculum sp.]MDP3328759.1 hypothetical protein [Parvibaculum sp.]